MVFSIALYSDVFTYNSQCNLQHLFGILFFDGFDVHGNPLHAKITFVVVLLSYAQDYARSNS